MLIKLPRPKEFLWTDCAIKNILLAMFRYVYWYKRKIPQRYKPIVLVTGCASGVGLALAESFSRLNRFRVVVTAREHSVAELREKLPETDNFIVRALDVTSKTNRRQLVDEICERWGAIDILINNAGIAYRAVVEHMSEEDEQLQMATNYFGPMGLIRAVIPYMRLKGRGKIINISSVSGMLAMPTMASYSASKYALEGASEALWYEMKPFGINVSLVQPGFLRSKSFQKVHYSKKSSKGKNENGPYQEYYKSMSPFVEKLMGISRTPPERVADLVFDVIYTEDPPLWIPATFDAEFFYYLRRIFPRRILHPMLFMALPNIKTWGSKFSRRRPGFFQYLFGRKAAK